MSLLPNPSSTNHNETFYFPFRVYLADTDAGGIVYHANHLNYFERARREWLRSVGLAHYSAREDYQFVVHHIDIAYQKPIFMDELVITRLTLVNQGFASLTLNQDLFTLPAYLDDLPKCFKPFIHHNGSVNSPELISFIKKSANFENLENNPLNLINHATKARIKLACVNKALKPCKIPADIVNAMASFS